jgi:hypothetical protein
VASGDDDFLDFDFVDDTTREAQSSGQRDKGSGGPRRPQIRLKPGWAPLLRLVGLVAFAILIVVLLVVWAQGCTSDRERDSYESYMTDLKAVGDDSAAIGASLAELLTTPGLKQDELETKLAGLIQQQQLGLGRAVELNAPGPVFAEHERALDALALRVAGMEGLLATFQATKTSTDRNAAGEQLAAQGRRLTSGDVVWTDLFRSAAVAELEGRDITGVAVPASVFVANPDLYATRSMTAIWQRIHGASTGGTPSGLHGNSLQSVIVQPSGQQLSPTTETTIQASTDLAFDVAVTNSGDFQEVQLEVTLTIPKQPDPIVKTGTIDLIDPGETKSITFTSFPDPPFGESTTVRVDVKPVPGEANTANNTAEFPVIFSLG